MELAFSVIFLEKVSPTRDCWPTPRKRQNLSAKGRAYV